MKELELTRREAKNRLILFLKLRKGKNISEKTISDFEKLIVAMWENFKSYNVDVISEYEINKNTTIFNALLAIRSGFINLENGSICKISNIEDVSYYVDEKYRVTVKGEKIVITQNDFNLIRYVLFGEYN